MCETPQDLIDYVSKIKDTLRLQETFRGKMSDRNEYQLLNNPNVYRRSTPAYIYLFNFIMNRVPSDLYRVKNPKLNIDHARTAPNSNELYSVISPHESSIQLFNHDNALDHPIQEEDGEND